MDSLVHRAAWLALAVCLSGCQPAVNRADVPKVPGKGSEPAKPVERPAAATASSPKADLPRWESLFDGKTLGQWKPITEYDFEDHGPIGVEKGELRLGLGSPASGVRWTGPMPKINYEIALDAKRTAGGDFFCGMTFPVGKMFCTLIVGGWGGTIVGLSNVDGQPASENETTQPMTFEDNRWYAIRLRVTEGRITVWIDEKKTIDLPTKDRELDIWWEVEPARPLGVSTYSTAASLRAIRIRRL